MYNMRNIWKQQGTRYKMQYRIKAHKYNSINIIKVDSLLLKKGINRIHNRVKINTINDNIIIDVKPIEEV